MISCGHLDSILSVSFFVEMCHDHLRTNADVMVPLTDCYVTFCGSALNARFALTFECACPFGFNVNIFLMDIRLSSSSCLPVARSGLSSLRNLIHEND